MKLPKKVAIIGGGASGIFMAEQLIKLADEQSEKISIVVFEKESHVGGKCRTYRDGEEPKLCSEFGAGALAANYGIVIDAMKKYGVEFEYMLPTEEGGIELSQLFADLPLSQKAQMAKHLSQELSQLDDAYLDYKNAKDNLLPLPENFETPFSEFCQDQGWQYMQALLKPLVPGFGYGDLTRCPTYSVLEYVGRMTLASMIVNDKILQRPPLLAIKGGFQTLIEQMAKSHDVRTGVNIESINRDNSMVTIKYQQGDNYLEDNFDCLILANSPMNWPSLGMELTKIEKQCVDELTYYRYPVAVVKVQGLPAKQYFFPEALEERGFGHVALITTRDNRHQPADGRLCTIYVNQLPGDNDFDFKKQWPSILQDLEAIDEVTGVDLIEEKYWSDYLPTLSWDLRLLLNKEQASPLTNTLYLGAYTLGTFEDVLSNANNAHKIAETLYGNNYTPVENFSWQGVASASLFYKSAYTPMDDSGQQSKEMRGCTIL